MASFLFLFLECFDAGIFVHDQLTKFDCKSKFTSKFTVFPFDKVSTVAHAPAALRRMPRLASRDAPERTFGHRASFE